LVECKNFTSRQERYGQYFNSTQTLNNGTYCVIGITADEGLARVVFENTNNLGVNIEGYEIGDVFTVDGGVQDITIYNGSEKEEAVTFILSFSGAFHALAATASALTLVTLF
jgi:hypothetical protein